MLALFVTLKVFFFFSYYCNAVLNSDFLEAVEWTVSSAHKAVYPFLMMHCSLASSQISPAHKAMSCHLAPKCEHHGNRERNG